MHKAIPTGFLCVLHMHGFMQVDEESLGTVLMIIDISILLVNRAIIPMFLQNQAYHIKYVFG